MDNRYIICPFCGIQRKLKKSGLYGKKPMIITKSDIRFDIIDPETAPFVEFKDLSNPDRKRAFQRIDFLNLQKAYQISDYQTLIEQLYNQCQKLLIFLTKLKK